MARALPIAASLLLASCAASTPATDPFAPVRFLVGGFRGEDRDLTVVEVWTAPIGDVMYGQNLTARGDALVAFELLRIVRRGTTLVYEARPQGGAVTGFALVDHGPGAATFANPDHDFPRRIHYRLDGDVLVARIDDGRDDGRALTFRWLRVR